MVEYLLSTFAFKAGHSKYVLFLLFKNSFGIKSGGEMEENFDTAWGEP